MDGSPSTPANGRRYVRPGLRKKVSSQPGLHSPSTSRTSSTSSRNERPSEPKSASDQEDDREEDEATPTASSPSLAASAPASMLLQHPQEMPASPRPLPRSSSAYALSSAASVASPQPCSSSSTSSSPSCCTCHACPVHRQSSPGLGLPPTPSQPPLSPLPATPQLQSPPSIGGIPTDEATLEKIRRIIAVQFDVEIEYKRRELLLIEDRLAEGELLLERLQDAWDNRGYMRLGMSNSEDELESDEDSEPDAESVNRRARERKRKKLKDTDGMEEEEKDDDFDPFESTTTTPTKEQKKKDKNKQRDTATTKDKDKENTLRKQKGKDKEDKEASHNKSGTETEATKKKKKTKISPHAGPLFVRKPDGSFLQLACPTCKREKFLNVLGFVNHCRIMHKIKFATHADAVLACGRPVNATEVPPDDPSRQDSAMIYFPRSTAIPPAEKSSTSDRGALENISRFYIKKKVIVGNTSKFIPLESRDGDDRATHKWMVYVRGPADEPDVSHFVKKVRFFLHPSFAPNDVVEVLHPPYHLTRRGWGEFPVRVQLHFVDTRNKPVDIIHHLKLDQTHSGLQMLGGETPVDVELDRRFFEEERSSTPNTAIPSKSATDLWGDTMQSGALRIEGGVTKGSGKGPVPPVSTQAKGSILGKRSREDQGDKTSEGGNRKEVRQVEVKKEHQHRAEGKKGEERSKSKLADKPNRMSRKGRQKPVVKVKDEVIDDDDNMEATVVKRRPREEEEDIDIIEIDLDDDDGGTDANAESSDSSSSAADQAPTSSAITSDPSTKSVLTPPAPQQTIGSADSSFEPFSFSNSPPSSPIQPSTSSVPPVTSPPQSISTTSVPISTISAPPAPLPTAAPPLASPASSAPVANIPSQLSALRSTGVADKATTALSDSVLYDTQDKKMLLADPLSDVSIPPQPIVTFPAEIEELLEEGVNLYPVVADKRGLAVLPYTFAKSEDAFRAWNLGKRKSTEWQRARKVREFVRSKLQIDIPTKKVVLWCRQHNKVPSVDVYVELEISVVRHCKYCGRTHLPLETFKATQKQCRRQLGETALISTLTPWKYSPSPAPSLPSSPPPTEVAAPSPAPTLMLVKNEPVEMDRSKDPISAHLEEVRTKLYEHHFKERPFLYGEIPKLLDEIDIPLDTSTEQGSKVENMLCKLAFCFARDLVRDSLLVCRRQEQARAGGPHEGVSLVPYHVFCAVRNNPQRDFLTNQGMANPTPVIIEENPFAEGEWETIIAAPISPSMTPLPIPLSPPSTSASTASSTSNSVASGGPSSSS